MDHYLSQANKHLGYSLRASKGQHSMSWCLAALIESTNRRKTARLKALPESQSGLHHREDFEEEAIKCIDTALAVSNTALEAALAWEIRGAIVVGQRQRQLFPVVYTFDLRRLSIAIQAQARTKNYEDALRCFHKALAEAAGKSRPSVSEQGVCSVN